jgi:serine/threonine protein kinase
MGAVSASADPAGRIGEIVGDRYELISLIGRGGQSEVYRAWDRVDGDHVAVKICQWTNQDAAERMFREAYMMSQLRGTSAVRVLHQCQTNDGLVALVMELLDGSDLASLLEVRECDGIRAEYLWMAPILRPIVRTLEAAHEQGIVHRDLKPENIFVLEPARGGGVRLLDFGFAKMTRMPGITAPDTVAGSPSYIAPEVWERGVACATAQADVYALGVLVFRVLGGRAPFAGTMLDIARGALSTARPSLRALRPDLPPDVDEWVLQVLAKDPEHRFVNIGAAWRALDGVFMKATLA